MDEKLQNIIDLDEKYYMHTFGKRTPVAFEYGKGIHLYSTDGTEYTDFFAGIAVNALGHAHPAVVKAISDQAAKLIHCSSLYYVEGQAELAKLICENSCADRVFFGNSGAEANEGAIKLARVYAKKKYGQDTKRTAFITLNKSFHGRTITTATATGQEKYRKPFTPLTPGFKYIDINDIDAFKAAMDDTICGVIMEPIQGESGVHPLTKEFAEEVRRICTENDVLLIFDEVQTGVGRTGKLFAYETLGVEPDVFTLAKALGAGVPIAAVCAKGPAAEAFAPGEHGSTFGGNPLACAAGIASLTTIINDRLTENAAEVGAYFKEKLLENKERLCIAEVRGSGLMIGIGLNNGKAAETRAKMFENRYLIGSVGADTLRILPPLIITKDDVDRFIEVLAKCVN